MSDLMRIFMMKNNQMFASTSSQQTTTNHQQQQQQQFLNHSADEQRQMALLNLFSSLSSLATNRQQQQPQQVSNQPPISQEGAQLMSSLSQQQQTLQSVMAAAMMQQPPKSVTSNSLPSSVEPQMQQMFHKEQQQQQQVNNAGQQRINYCTICNKELCNKYFMKTHMLKMHGINLEMETSQYVNGESDNNNNINTSEQEEEEQPEDCSQANCSLLKNKRNNNKSPQSNQSNQSNQVVAKTTTGTNAGGTSKSATNAKQTTSVMNGFAGNSMGGVICDICNKELCSKYFLKVHKQNTHGIATDNYHDGSAGGPFAAIYPFVAAAGFGPFQPPVSGFFEHHPHHQSQTQGAATQETAEAQQEKLRVKKIRLAHQNIESKTTPADHSEKFESLYRLMLAQQSQQQQQQQPPHQSQPNDPIALAMNPLSALMCFGGAQQAAAGPFGMQAAASLSPAMIVDQILRNQHLFNQQQHQRHHTANSKPIKQTDRNSNGSEQASITTNKKTPGANSSESNNNKRYFSHYTEACPMCDRRFKSIKWLKTHMMNDHKHEIGAYMQSMMQYLYQTNKSQQQQLAAAAAAAAAASMAAFESHHQQHQPALFHQPPQYLAQPGNQLTSAFQQQQQQGQVFNRLTNPSQTVPFVDHAAAAAQHQQQQQQQYLTNRESNFALFDARCTNRREPLLDQRAASLSPAESNHHHRQQQQPQHQIKRELPIIENFHHLHHQVRPSSLLMMGSPDEAHDLSASHVDATATSGGSSPACELNFDLSNRNETRQTFISSPVSPPPGNSLTLRLDSHTASNQNNNDDDDLDDSDRGGSRSRDGSPAAAAGKGDHHH